MKKLMAVLAASMLFGLAGATAQAQSAYPTRPVKIMIAFPVDGLLDTVDAVEQGPSTPSSRNRLAM